MFVKSGDLGKALPKDLTNHQIQLQPLVSFRQTKPNIRRKQEPPKAHPRKHPAAASVPAPRCLDSHLMTLAS